MLGIEEGGGANGLGAVTRRQRERDCEVFTGRKVASLSAAEMEQARRAGYEPDGEYLIGRDPREMTRAELEAIGHEPMSPLEVFGLRGVGA